MFRYFLLASTAAFVAFPAFAQTAPAVDAELEEISVTANLTPTPTREVGSAVTVITREELEQRQIRLVSDALRGVPGVALNRSGPVGGISQARIRGGEGNHTLVLIDGVEVNNPASSDEFDFAHLQAHDIERIEVLRGSQSALYGSDAIGGVINIVTRRGEGVPKVSGFAEGGTRGTAAAGGTFSGATDRAHYIVSGSGLRTDGHSIASEWRGNPEEDGYRNLAGFAKLGVQAFDNLKFDFVGRGTDYEGDNDPDFGTGPFDSTVPGVQGKQFLGRAQATLDLLDGRWQQMLGVSGTRNEYDTTANDVVDYSNLGTTSKIDYRTTYSFDTGPVAVHTVTFGAEHEDDRFSNSFSAVERQIEQTGLVGQYQIGLWDDLFLTGSVRRDMNDLFGDVTTYRTTGAYHIRQTDTKIRASWGTGIKNPTMFELYGFSDSYQGNPDLRPERGEGWDVGIDQSLFDGLVVVEATYFQQEITDRIVDNGVSAYNDPGKADIDGVELGASIRPFDGMTVRASYTWLDGTDALGARLTRRPEHQASLHLDYAFLEGQASLGASALFVGEQTDKPFSLPLQTLDGYTVIDLRGSYRLNENAQLYARVENLLDEEYEEAFGYGSVGRTGIAGLKVNF